MSIESIERNITYFHIPQITINILLNLIIILYPFLICELMYENEITI